MPLLLYAYLATEVLAPFLAALLILNAILFLGKLVPLLEGIFSFGIGAADFVRLWAYMSPQLLLFSIPMASMLGVLIGFTRLANENEIIALKAAGVSIYRMLPPVLAIAVATASLTGLASVHLIPHGTVAMKKLLFRVAKEKIDRGMREKQFSEGLSDVVVYVDKIVPGSNEWNGVYVSDLRDKKTPLTVIARRGLLKAHMAEMRITLELLDGSMHRSLADLTQTIRFKRYRLDLPINMPRAVLGKSTVGLDKNTLTQGELLQHARKLRPDNPRRNDLLIEFHERLVLPVGCFILTLLALPLALPVRPGGRSWGMPLGLGLFFLYYISITAAKALSEGTALPVGIGMWVPNLLFGGMAVWLVRRAAREKSTWLSGHVPEIAHRLTALLKTGREKSR